MKLETIYIALLAAPVGFLGSLLGVGGGTFLIPLLVVGLSIEPVDAIPISLFCAFSTGLGGVFNVELDRPLLKKSLLLQPPALVGVALCSPLAHIIATKYMLLSFAIFILAIALFSTFKIIGDDENREVIIDEKAMLSAFIAGGCSGLFGIGGGIVLVPFLRIFSRVSLKDAMQISLSVLISTSAFGILVHTYFHDTNWQTGLLAALATAPAGMLGRAVRVRLPNQVLRYLFVVCAFSMAAVVFIKALSP